MARIFLAIPFGIALALGGCQSFDGHVNDDVQVSAIIDKIECELQDAFTKHAQQFPELKRWSASFVLDLQRDSVGSVTPTVGYSVPMAPGTFRLDATSGVTGKKLRQLNFKRTIPSLSDLGSYTCTPRPENGVFTGSLGIADAFSDFLGGTDKGDKVTGPEEVGYTIEFDLKYEAGVTPNFIFTRITGLGLGLSASEEKRNKLTFAFADNPPQVVKTLPVYVTNFPHVHASGMIPDTAPAALTANRRLRQTTASNPDKRGQPGSRQHLYSGSVSPETRYKLDSVLMRMNLQSLRLR